EEQKSEPNVRWRRQRLRLETAGYIRPRFQGNGFRPHDDTPSCAVALASRDLTKNLRCRTPHLATVLPDGEADRPASRSPASVASSVNWISRRRVSSRVGRECAHAIGVSIVSGSSKTILCFAAAASG